MKAIAEILRHRRGNRPPDCRVIKPPTFQPRSGGANAVVQKLAATPKASPNAAIDEPVPHLVVAHPLFTDRLYKFDCVKLSRNFENV